jgi:hypothetical protein
MMEAGRDAESTLFIFSAVIFHEAVDPVKLNIPHYFDVIPRENARDLSLIKAKLNANRYETVEDFEADVYLMVCHFCLRCPGMSLDWLTLSSPFFTVP